MCDERQLETWARKNLTRRQVGAMGAGGAAVAAVSACAPMAGDAASASASRGISERAVSFVTPDGTQDGEFFALGGRKAPGVIFWTDIAGIRPAKRQMARRLAEAGYAVLLANPYYRDVKGQQFSDFADFAGNGGWDKVKPWRARFSADTVITDARAAANWLRSQREVDAGRGIGAQGYCMTGSFAVIAPAAAPEIKAGASFHGGGLVRADLPKSAHKMLEAGNRYLIAIAQDDHAKAPGDTEALRRAASAAGVPAEIDVYPADHGWCVLDSPAYNPVQAERAWDRLLATYRAAL